MPRFFFCFDSRTTTPPTQAAIKPEAGKGLSQQQRSADGATVADLGNDTAAFVTTGGKGQTAARAGPKQGWSDPGARSSEERADVTTTQVLSFGAEAPDANDDYQPRRQPANVTVENGSSHRQAHRQAEDGSSHRQAHRQAEDGSSTPVQIDVLLNGTRKGSYSMFSRFDSDSDGLITKDDLSRSMQELGLKLSQEMYRQFIECNFVYADRDHDGYLSFDEFHTLYKLICEIRSKFKRYDTEGQGQINKKAFENIVKELNLNLDGVLLKQYVDINFRYADRNLKGTISFGQFLACYANFLYTYEVTNNRARHRHQPAHHDVLVEDF